MQSAYLHLKLEQHLTYPSAYLVPSLFRHPDSVPYRVPARGWRSHLQQWLPSSRQAIALARADYFWQQGLETEAWAEIMPLQSTSSEVAEALDTARENLCGSSGS